MGEAILAVLAFPLSLFLTLDLLSGQEMSRDLLERRKNRTWRTDL